MVQSKRSQQIEWYKQELEDANNTRNQVLESGLSAQLRGDKSSMKVHLLMLKNIDALIDRLYQNTIALLGDEKVYLQEQCYSDNTRTLYAPVTCQASKHCHETEDLIATNYGLICPDCYGDMYDENNID